MEEYIKWLENKIEFCLEDKDLQREHWAFCQALSKYHEVSLRQPLVGDKVCTFYMSGMGTSSKCNNCGKNQWEHSVNKVL